jgi:hypothetical protein
MAWDTLSGSFTPALYRRTMGDTKSNMPPCHPFCVTGTLRAPQLSTDRCRQGAELSRDLHSSNTRSGVDSDAMVFITQLVYVHPGKESVFDEFEAVAIPLIGKHGGELLLRLRPAPESVIERSIELPYEIHLVRFPNDEAFERFATDGERQGSRSVTGSLDGSA